MLKQVVLKFTGRDDETGRRYVHYSIFESSGLRVTGQRDMARIPPEVCRAAKRLRQLMQQDPVVLELLTGDTNPAAARGISPEDGA